MEKTDAPQGQVQSAQGRNTLKVGFQVLAGSILFLAAMYAVILGALHTHFHIHHDTKHKHKDDTPPGTQVLMDRGGDDLTMSLTTVHHSGDAAVCGLLHGDFGADPVDRARSLGGVNDITLAYQGAEAQHLLHLRVGSIRHSVPDDLEDAEAVVGEIRSASGDFNLVLQQGGVVSVKEDGELFATEVVCEVAEGEQRRRLNLGSSVLRRSAPAKIPGSSLPGLVCTCANGVAATDGACPLTGGEVCASCNGDSYELVGKTCQQKCTCAHGVPATGADCSPAGHEVCASCDGPFYQCTGSGADCKGCFLLLPESEFEPFR